MKTYWQLYKLLSPKERRRGLIVILLSLLMGFVDILGAASILPFLALMGNKKIIDSNIFLYSLRNLTRITDYEDFLFFLGIFVFLILLVSLLIKTLANYALLRFCALREYSLSKRLLKLYLGQPYLWFNSRNSSEIAKNILSEANDVIRIGLMPFMNLISGSIVAISMILVLLIFTPSFAFISLLVFLISYLTIYKFIKKILIKTGEEKLISNKERFNSINEVFGAVKQVKLSGLEDEFIKRYSKSALSFASSTSKARIIDTLPRYFVEAIGFGGMMIAILYLMKTYGDITSALPSIGLCVYAGYRLLPSLQLIYQSIARVKYAEPIVDNLYKDFSRLKSENKRKRNSKRIYPEKYIKLENVKFSYTDKSNFTLEDINIKIKANKSSGFVGLTGSGKTTLIDIILGLLDPEKGSIMVDDLNINKKNCSLWQDSIGYVPQDIYLSDDSIAANIAFGNKKFEFDFKRIKEMARIAEIDDFIENVLPNGYETYVGERGVKLSGGQRQRIGIARALYINPKILILDEATSALDNITEKKLMNNIFKLPKKITTLIIAHRLSTLINCDEIFLLEKGKIIESGNYNALLVKSILFKKMHNSAN